MTFKQQQKAWKKWKKEYEADFFYSDLEHFLYTIKDDIIDILDKHYKV